MKKSALCITYAVYLMSSIFLLLNSCKKTEKKSVETCSYSGNVKSIVASKCALSGCHGAGSPVGDFTVFDNLKTRADNGRLHKNVIELKVMPPASASQLTEAEMEQLKCWMHDGAKQN